ncbi:Major facilitator, sugar transporter-like [Dillenia turbinata]|uniref:Major facilitator, sugar transporter-like n=1 Tax=Dillenia turbinata TaxID=194707 RepID=A0AAN8VKU6_9MAGN
MAPFLEMLFPSIYRLEEEDKSTNQYCKFNSQTLTLFTSSLYLAALVASFFASWITRKLGRKVTTCLGVLVFLAGATINSAAINVAMLIVGRILLGVGVGFPIQSLRNVMSLPCFIHVIEGGWGWRLSLGGAAVPAIFIAVSAFILPDTPNSMLERGKHNEALEMLRKIHGVDSGLFAASEASKQVAYRWRNILLRKYRPQLTMSILIPSFQQLTGINVVMFYAPVLFKTLGFGSNASLFSSVITGAFNSGATFVSVYGTDNWGRTALFMEGGIQMLIFQSLVALLIGEIFPLVIRSAAQSITVSVNMLFTFAVAQVFLTMLCHLKFGLFIFFAAFVFGVTVFVYFFLPKTKGTPIEDMNRVWREHW